MSDVITARGTTLGVVGGGQLGRMLAEAAAPLGVETIVLDPTPNCPASIVARDQIEAEFDDTAGIAELADRTDFLTIEIELADPEALQRVSADTGVPVHPAPSTIRMIQDKLVQKRHLQDAGVPVPSFRAVENGEDIAEAIAELGPVMLKAREGGYDGRGNVPVARDDDFTERHGVIGNRPAMAEEFIDFERELSVIGIVGENDVRAFTVGENRHDAEILRTTIVPARTTAAVKERAREVAFDALSVLDGRGVYAVELFETASGEVLVNEIAPRPHNSGHWTIEGAVTSQFEQHVRAVTARPLGSTARRCPTVMVNILGDVTEPSTATLTGVDGVLSTPGAHLHWYGKREARPLRKMGHITLTPAGDDTPAGDVSDTGGTIDTLVNRANDLRDGLTFRN